MDTVEKDVLLRFILNIEQINFNVDMEGSNED